VAPSYETSEGRPVPGLERIIFFSDAVFAIAITLLAIDVRLPVLPPHLTNDALLRALGDLRPEIFAFVISFVVIAAFWVGHYRTFRVIVQTDGRLITINLAFLFCIAALPFPTSVLAGQGDLVVAVVFYAAFGVVTGLASTLLWIYPVRAGLVSPTVTPDIAKRVRYRALVVPVVFAASIPVAFIAPYVAELFWVLMVPAQAIVSQRLGIRHALDSSLHSA
jgi:uncharacterized membrane protein